MLTRDKLETSEFGLFYERLRDWREDEFLEVVEVLGRECNRFPSLSKFYAARPVRYSTGELKRIREDEERLRRPVGVSVFDNDPSRRVGDDLDEEIDSLSEEQLLELFRASGVSTEGAARWLYEQHLRSPYSIYREYLRDEISARRVGEEWKRRRQMAEERQGLS